MAINTAVVAPALTVIDDAALRTLLVFDMITTAPPAVAALFRVTVQLVEVLDARLAGMQVSDDTTGGTTGAVRLSKAVVAAPLSVAVTVAV